MSVTKNNNQPLVAIGVPVYNGEKYLEACLESILNQSYDNWECLISENCSKDNSQKIAESFAKKDKRFKVYICPEFVDHVGNWNNTYLHSNQEAKYFKMVQADDMILPECLEKYVDLMEKNPNVGVASSYRLNDLFVDMGGVDILEGNVFNGKDILYKQLVRDLDISGTCTTNIFSMKHLKSLSWAPNIFNGKFHIDTELFYDLCNISDCGFVYQVLTYTRRHEESGTSTLVYNWGTLYQLNEEVLFRFKGDNERLNKEYKKERLDYAYFFLTNKIMRKKPVLDFHRKVITRWFTTSEYLQAIITRNKFSVILKKIWKKLN